MVGLAQDRDLPIRCDQEWRTEEVTLNGWLGSELVRREIKVDARRHWYFDGVERPDFRWMF